MVLFPGCKINIGLDVLRRREDGFHDIETVMFPVRGLTDVLEIVPSHEGTHFTCSGLAVDCPEQDNLCLKAYRLMRERFGIGDVKIHLHKIVPFGAGLGGGSADAAGIVTGLDRLFRLGMTSEEMKGIAAELGSDTPFFIGNDPVIAWGRGEIMFPIEIPELTGNTLLIIKPPFGIPTAKAYAGIVPELPGSPLDERIKLPLSEWRSNISNKFEGNIFEHYPILGEAKENLYAAGALYASMTGSGSALYGIFPAGDTSSANRPCGPQQGLLPGLSRDWFDYQEVIA